jgi:predicted RNA-binding Zn-ribbon protein involved in translation (DUF1610 family)
MSQTRFRCPACGFQIFNRRVQKCESCGNSLPAELLFTSEEIKRLDAEHERTRKEREELSRKSRSHDISGPPGADGFGSLDPGGDGDGGGCD